MRRLPLILLFLVGSALAVEDLPVPAVIVAVGEGATLEVRTRVGKASITDLVVVRGVALPERAGGCAAERRRASAAREFLAGLVGRRVQLKDLAFDQYQRTLATVLLDGRDLATVLIEGGYARRQVSSGSHTRCSDGADDE